MGIAQLYSNIFLYLIILLTIVNAVGLKNENYTQIKKGNNNSIIALILCIFLSIWLGLRPPTYAFDDTGNYALVFSQMKNSIGKFHIKAGEWLWSYFTYFCSQTIEVSQYFTIISIGYFCFTFFACRILVRNNVLAIFLFMLGSFSFYTYAVNGIRNGLACSIVLFIIALQIQYRKQLLFSLILSFFAISIHKSALLPIASLFLSTYLVKSFKTAYTFWIISILISLIAGGVISSFFAGLGFDERVSYLTSFNENKFSHTGFRWDFLIYSLMPIVLGYYIVIKRGIKNRSYEILLNTYTLANAFWVMVIRANYSNRFAYLSWFMYPIVLAYPLLKLNVWGDDQGKRLSQIMIAHVGFTWFMQTLY